MLCAPLQTTKLIATGSLLYKSHMIAAVPLTDSSLLALPAVSAHMSVRPIAAVGGTAVKDLSVSAVLKDPRAVDKITDVRQAAHVAALITDQGSQESTS
jgi:hypothetical protein